ncbi:MAG: hypothetical protein LBR38_01655, partial [Synergistaceae bacterium]|nr:hypothetical protein [Synergistaceae bacterium]
MSVPKFFNTAGPGKADLNYLIDPLRRINYDEVITMIDQQRYFVLHAPRQTGKTTSLLAMVRKINAEGRYRCVYINVEQAQAARSDVANGLRAIVSELGYRVNLYLGDPEPSGWISQIMEEAGAFNALAAMLRRICATQGQEQVKPLVLFV